MKLSTKSRYALRAMVDLLVHSKNGHVPLHAIAKRQNISENYLESMFALLRKEDLVYSVKGQQGGYFPALPADEITVGRVVKAIEGNLAIVEKNLQSNDTTGIRNFLNEAVWQRVDQKIDELLEGTTLNQLCT